MHFIYKITNIINGKIYIGQTKDVEQRWRAHKSAFKNKKPTQTVHYAIIKHGLNNFTFEVIASCFDQDAANEAEEICIKQFNCLVSNGKGYNHSLGGMVAPKSEEWKQALKEWRDSLSPEERAEISKKQSEATIKQIETQGHPGLGTKRTDEQRTRMSIIQQSKDNEAIYNEEVRQRMSEAHIGIKDSEETKQRKAESAKEAWENRIDYSRKCEAPGCEVSGKVKYKIINGVRYCNKHGLRMLRYNRLDTLDS